MAFGQNHSDYAGDLSPRDAWALLEREPAAQLVDVRTAAEWNFVGLPDLSALARKTHCVEWQSFPSMQVDGRFAARLSTMLEASGVKPGAPLLFICRSGARSRQATVASLTGPRGGVILTNDPDIAKKINSAVFPGMQGGPLEHVIAAKAVSFKVAAGAEFADRQRRRKATDRRACGDPRRSATPHLGAARRIS